MNVRRLTREQIRELRLFGLTFAQIAKISGEDVPRVYMRWAQAMPTNSEQLGIQRLVEKMARRRIAAEPNTPEGFYQRERFQSRVI